MGIHFNKHEPIYKQIVDHICQEIVKGTWEKGEKLPSVRDYAVEVGVNVNTIQRVYQELERKQIAVVKRGQGTFITENEQYIIQLREGMKQELVRQFVKDMENMGYPLEDMIKSIEKEVYRND